MSIHKQFPVMLEPRRRGNLHVPWSVAEQAYTKYSSLHGTRQSLARLAERGGFYESEMDRFCPGWRQETGKAEGAAFDVC